MTPRQPVGSVAYAIRAGDADSVDGVHAADVQAALAELQALKAMFWSLTIEPPQGSGSTSPATGSYGYSVGYSSSEVCAVPASGGWTFDHWEGTAVTGQPATNPITIASGAAGETKTLKAVFVPPWTLTIEAPQGNGSTSLAAGNYEYAINDSSPAITAVPDANWTFDHWEGTAVTGQPTTNPITIAPGAAGETKTLKAVFVPPWTLTIEPPQGSGSTSLAAGSYAYAIGVSSPAITAVPTSGCVFVQWEGTALAAPSCVNPITIASGTQGQTKTLKAVFVQIPMCLVGSGTFKTSTSVNVSLNIYYIDTYEVTNQLYCAFLNAGGNDDHWRGTMAAEISRGGSAAPYTYQVVSGWAQRPVRRVTWNDATDFCAWRSVAEGRPAGTYRLPTEAEWEKAAGWGDLTHLSLWTYAFQRDTIDSTRANYNSNIGTTTDVGAYTYWMSWYGCYDMTGNVWEWCSDWAGGSYPSSTSNPTGPATGTERVLRGGSWGNDASFCQIATRISHLPTEALSNCGFRCVR